MASGGVFLCDVLNVESRFLVVFQVFAFVITKNDLQRPTMKGQVNLRVRFGILPTLWVFW